MATGYPADPGPRRRPGLVAAVALGAAVAVLPGPADARVRPQVDLTTAPVTVVSADGRTGTDGTRTLAVSQAADLDPTGATVSVSGSGYDPAKGIYVALCVITPRTHAPSPCGGGVDTEGTQGAAQWISSNPPSYGVGLAQPYGPGGSFVTTFSVRAEVAPGVDCRQVRCALVTRNDHTRSSDRSQDLVIPVAFATAPTTTAPPPPAAGPTPTEPAAAPTPAGPSATTAPPTVTVPPLAATTTTVAPPSTTVAPDGLAVTDGARTLRVSRAGDLDPDGETLTVTGEGFDPGRGIYVGVCAVPADGSAPGPCRSGSPEASRWVSSDPPDYGAGLAVPFADGGTFTVELRAAALVDATTDCRAVPCAVVVRADDTAPGDRALDLTLPISFAATAPGTTVPGDPTPSGARPADGGATDLAGAVTIDDTGTGGAPVGALAAGGVAAAGVAGAAIAVARRRSTGLPS